MYIVSNKNNILSKKNIKIKLHKWYQTQQTTSYAPGQDAAK